MTRRERLEAKSEKRRQWAESRRKRSEACFDKFRGISDQIPFGQPILVGHHSERRHRRDIDRMDNAVRDGVESAKMADHHESKADGIEAALDSSIFSDDADAIEALEARIKARESDREKIKAYNKACRGGARGDEALRLLDGVSERKSWFESYAAKGQHLSTENITAKIAADRVRLASVKDRQSRMAKASAAGGVVIERGTDYCRVTFAEKPDRATIDALKAAGFRWGGGSWSGRLDRLPESVAALCPA